MDMSIESSLNYEKETPKENDTYIGKKYLSRIILNYIPKRKIDRSNKSLLKYKKELPTENYTYIER